MSILQKLPGTIDSGKLPPSFGNTIFLFVKRIGVPACDFTSLFKIQKKCLYIMRAFYGMFLLISILLQLLVCQ